MIEMTIREVLYDRKQGTPVVFLQETGGDRVLPLWVGPSEAHAILVGQGQTDVPRPLTHELAHRIIAAMGGKMLKVIVTEVKDSVYHARVLLQASQEVVSIDARPSDGLALAVRTGCPIYVDDSLEMVTVESLEAMPPEDVEGALRKLLKTLRPEDLGDFPLE